MHKCIFLHFFLIAFTIQIKLNMGNYIKLLPLKKTNHIIMDIYSTLITVKTRQTEHTQQSFEYNFRVSLFSMYIIVM